MKLRKIITMGLAAIMAVSAMSISAFAAADTETKSTVSRYEETEKEHILEALRQTGNNKSKAAQLLNIDRKTLYNKLKLYNIEL